MSKPILITGFVPGYPNSKLSFEIAKTCIAAGADILELSASFSEPVADGPTLQLAHQRVLASGFTKSDAFALYKKIKVDTKAPLFLIEYANIIYKMGFDKYYTRARASGINYITVPDVPLEESAPFVAAAKKHELAQIFLIAPTTPDKRVKEIVRAAGQTKNDAPLSTFLYLVSVTGVTGSRQNISPETKQFIKRVRKLTDLPLIVGFGISQVRHVKDVMAASANGVVTCSKIVDIIHRESEKPKLMLNSISSYIQNLTV